MGESVHPEAIEDLKATKQEVVSLINVILYRLDDVFLIFDGVDECSDTEDFFGCLREATVSYPVAGSSTTNKTCRTENGGTVLGTRLKVALFSRPDLKIPREQERKASWVKLQPDQNFLDIRTYFSQNLLELVDEQLITQSSAPQQLAHSLSQRADGIILWAKLLIEFIKCDTFSPQERLELMNDTIMLEGLEQLYHAILQKLQRNLPTRAREKIRKAFTWAIGGVRPLSVTELTDAMTLPMNTEDSKTGYPIPNIEGVLTRVSGGLLEVVSDRTVRLAHTSVKEYLLSKPMNPMHSIIDFKFDEAQVHLDLARACLYYIGSIVPSGSLSGTPDVTAGKELIIAKYPLIQYSCNLWVEHCRIGASLLAELRGALHRTHYTTITTLANNINQFLGVKEQVSTWIEASWLLGSGPSTQSLVSALDHLYMSGIPPPTATCIESLLAKVWLFSNDLEELRKKWAAVLQETPNEIWLPSISSLTPSEFWVTVSGSAWTQLQHKLNCEDEAAEDEKVIMIESQTSNDSLELASVKILVPR